MVHVRSPLLPLILGCTTVTAVVGLAFVKGSSAGLAKEVFTILIFACIARLAILEYRISGWSSFLWLVLASSFLTMLFTDVNWASGTASHVVDVEAYLAAVVWLIAALAIAPTILGPDMRPHARTVLILGFVLQGLVFFLYLAREPLVEWPALRSPGLQTIGDALELSFLASYFFGLALVTMAAPLPHEVKRGCKP